ncbi:MAG: DNA-formamidopyrimidine glycosylase family protein [Planctomycetota bacterium]
MPELPDVLLYVDSLRKLLAGRRLESISVRSPSLLRTFTPDQDTFANQQVTGFDRIGKRIVWEFESGSCIVIHLMIAGRFHWKKKRTLPKGKNDLAAFHFNHGSMMLTEASSHKRAGIWLLEDRGQANELDPGGIDVLNCSESEFRNSLLRSNNTLKRALTDPKRFDGIGNAYSDEILQAAGLSPLRKTRQLDEEEIGKLFSSTQETLMTWISRLQDQAGDKFPEKVTAFRPEMAVHGKFGEPCPSCGSPVQRIRYANKECNYCPKCQTDGRMLADRSLSRLLKDDWPKTLEDLEE